MLMKGFDIIIIFILLFCLNGVKSAAACALLPNLFIGDWTTEFDLPENILGPAVSNGLNLRVICPP